MRGPVGQTGAAGPHGPQGNRGESGIFGLRIVTAVFAVDDVDNPGTKSGSVECATAGEGLSAVSGGAALSGAHGGNVAIVMTRPIGVTGQVPAGWEAGAIEVNSTAEHWTLTVYAVCANVNTQ